MIEPILERDVLPIAQVYIQKVDRSLIPADEQLSGEVYDSLAKTRERILDEFGDRRITAGEDTLSVANRYFQDRGWSVPKSVVIDPLKDAEKLRSIMQEAKFRSPSDEEFFTGANDTVISPGGSPQHDLVIFHDWREKYRTELVDRVQQWGYRITDEEVEEVAEQSVADFIVHELSHLAGGLAISAVVLMPDDEGYIISERDTFGFVHVENDIPMPSLNEAQDYYAGPALDEGWAALNASNCVLTLQGYPDRSALPLDERFDLNAEITNGDTDSQYYSVAGLHSREPGMILEKLNELYPGTIDLMTSVADGKTALKIALSQLKATLPSHIYSLLLKPNYNAWTQLKGLVELDEE